MWVGVGTPGSDSAEYREQREKFITVLDLLYPLSVRRWPLAVKFGLLDAGGEHLISLTQGGQPIDSRVIADAARQYALACLYADLVIFPMPFLHDNRRAEGVPLTALWACGPRVQERIAAFQAPPSLTWGTPGFIVALWLLDEPVTPDDTPSVDIAGRLGWVKTERPPTRSEHLLCRLNLQFTGTVPDWMNGTRLEDQGLILPLSYFGQAAHHLKHWVKIDDIRPDRRYSIKQLEDAILIASGG